MDPSHLNHEYHDPLTRPAHHAKTSLPVAKRHDWIGLENLRVACILGMYEYERSQPQSLRVDLRLAVETNYAATSCDLQHSVDYAQIAKEVTFILTQCRFRMIETACEALAQYLLAPPLHLRRAPILKVKIKIVKENALGALATPSLAIERDSCDYTCDVLSASTSVIQNIHHSVDAAIRRHFCVDDPKTRQDIRQDPSANDFIDRPWQRLQIFSNTVEPDLSQTNSATLNPSNTLRSNFLECYHCEPPAH